MTDSPLMRRALVGAVALFIVAGVLAAAVVGGGDGGDGSQVAAGSTTTTAATTLSEAPLSPVAGDGGTGQGGADPGGAALPAGAPSTTAGTSAKASSQSAPAGTAPSTTAAASSPAPASGFADLGPAADGGKVAVPKAGLYRYSFKGPEREGEASTRVEDKGDAGGGARKLLMTIMGQGFDSKNDVVWGTSEVRVAKSTFAFGGREGECDWEPDHLEMKLPLAKEATWQSASSCSVSGFGPTPIVLKRTTTNKVTDARRVRVAGQEIDVWVITGTEKFETPQGGGETTNTTWFSAAHGMIVRSTSQTAEGSIETEIRNLNPE